MFRIGDRVRYIGHTSKCKTCALSLPDDPPDVKAKQDGLGDEDVFGDSQWSWDYRIGAVGEVTGEGRIQVWVDLDEDEECNIYIDHLEEEM